MIKTVWKPAGEIRQSLKGARSVTILSCGTCANLSNTGGGRSLRFLKGLLKEWGIEVVAAKNVSTCCPEESMRYVLKRYRRYISRSDALIMLSCSGGIKAAYLCDPGIPVIAALDTMGSVPVSHRNDPVARSVCTYCEHCVISFTGGICPLYECPARSLYGPCKKYPSEGDRCALDPERNCVWKEISVRGDLEALKELALVHQSAGDTRLSPPPRRRSPAMIRRISGWVVARANAFHRFVPFID